MSNNNEELKEKLRDSLENSKKRFEDSIKFARDCGVEEDKIIHNSKELDDYFS